MDTSESLRGKAEVARKRLIEEGAASYLDARVALNEFRSEVQSRCREVLKSRLRELRELTDLDLDEDRIELVDWPSEPNLEWASLGAQLQLKDHHLSIYVAVVWESEQDKAPKVCAQATISTWYKHQFNSAWPRFKAAQAEKYDDRSSHDIYFQDAVTPGKIGEFEQTIGNMLDKLARAWKAAGGLKAFRG